MNEPSQKAGIFTLPCSHVQHVVDQVQPTINLLTNLDTLHPDILLQYSIQPTDYKNGLVFRSAIESIRGTYIASSTIGREGIVSDVLENLLHRNQITDYKHLSSKARYDFEIVLHHNPDLFAALEVKGGEGNSINISERPIWASEFGVWCHLDGAIVNQPAHGAHSIINRLVSEMVFRNKQVDVVFFKDILCGTRTRPCPKYSGREEIMGLNTAPDVFLFPQRIPTLNDPEPPVHTLQTLSLPRLILELFGIDRDEQPKHIWSVHIRTIGVPNTWIGSEVEIRHQGKLVDRSKSRPRSLK